MSTYTVREPGVSGAHKVSNWPLEMFEELATNCILHKKYSRPQYIGIYVYHDHLSFANHNRPPPPITIEDLNEKTDFDDRKYLNEELKGMFFNLDLIQSYGSGIRRAKKAMMDNGSPRLVFSPDNDTDDYTQVIAYINPAFARIQEEERRNVVENVTENVTESVPENVTENVTDNVTKSISSIAQQLIDGYSRKKQLKMVVLLKAISSDSHITIEKMAQTIGATDRTIKRYLKDFQDAGILERVGSDTNGEWILSEETKKKCH